MRVSGNLGRSAGLTLQRAVLVYGSKGADGETYASMHSIALTGDEKKPVIGPGVPIEGGEFRAICEKLSGAKVRQAHHLIPANVLVSDVDMLCWHQPSQRRTVFFRSKDEHLDALSGHEARHPALLFVARPKALYIWALDSDERPTLESKLYRAPYMNVYQNGHLCEGNFKLPDHLRPEGIEHWERGFFDTSFSHTNIDLRSLTQHPGGHVGLWEACCATGRKTLRRFEPAWLLLLDTTGQPWQAGREALTLQKVLEGK